MGLEKQAPLTEGLSPKARWISLGVLVLVHLGLASALALIPVHGIRYPNRPLIGLILGITFGQISLTAAWCAFGPGRFFLRVPLALMAASFSGLALAAFMHRASPNSNDFWFSVALVLVGWFLLQPPLWTISSVWKCSLRLTESSQERSSEAMQFTLAHMLLWTLGVALLLGIGRMALRDAQFSPSRGWGREDIMFFLIFVVVNFLLAIPVTLVMLALKQFPLRVLAAISWSLVLGVLECVCLAIIGGHVIEPSSLAMVILLNFIHGTVLAGSLLVLTAVGYRWQRSAMPPERAVQ